MEKWIDQRTADGSWYESMLADETIRDKKTRIPIENLEFTFGSLLEDPTPTPTVFHTNLSREFGEGILGFVDLHVDTGHVRWSPLKGVLSKEYDLEGEQLVTSDNKNGKIPSMPYKEFATNMLSGLNSVVNQAGL